MGMFTRWNIAEDGGPECEPVTLKELLDWLRLTDYDNASILGRLIRMATEQAEEITNLAFITRSIVVRYDALAGELVLPCPPVQTVEAVKYIDIAGVEQEVDEDLYELGQTCGVGRVRLAYNQVWPSDVRGQPESVWVEATCGHGDEPGDCPERARQFILDLAGFRYVQRLSVVTGQAASEVPGTMAELLATLKRDIV
jgi:uncharacterized phiE125 gp8 family phage protein